MDDIPKIKVAPRSALLLLADFWAFGRPGGRPKGDDPPLPSSWFDRWGRKGPFD